MKGRPGTTRCGTLSGYALHGKKGEPYCEPCRTAKREYARQLKRRKLQESYGVYAPAPASPGPLPKMAVEPVEKGGYPEGWHKPKGAEVKRFADGEPVLQVKPPPRPKPDHEPDELDLAWRRRARLAAYGRGE